VLAAGYGRGEVLDVEPGWRRDLHHIDTVRVGELLKGIGAVEDELWIDGRFAEAGVQFVEVGSCGCCLIRKDVGEGDDVGGGVPGEGRGDGGAATAAAEQTETHGGVGLVAEGGLRLQEQEARGCAGHGYKFPSVDCLLFRRFHACFLHQAVTCCRIASR